MLNEMITQLPTVGAASLSDITMAVQGYINPSSPGLSVQETWQQVFNLFMSNTILSNAGNPNGSVAGTTYQLLWDTTNNLLWVCTTSGSTTTAVWKKSLTFTAGTGITIVQNGNNIAISASATGLTWNNAITATVAMSTNNGYYTNYSSGLLTYTLPTTSSFGDILRVVGGSTGGWSIAQNSGQNIVIGTATSTTGVGGSVSSTYQKDGIELVCVVANTTWEVNTAPQGNLTVV